MDITTLVVIGVVVVLALIIAFSSLRIANEYERGVVFRLGRLIALKGPGLFFIIPFGVDRLVKIDLRVITLEVPPQEVITNDNVTAKVNAVIYFQVVDAQRAVTQVLNYINATSQIAQTTLRAALGQATLDDLLANREKINQNLQKIIDEQTEPWGIKVAVVEIKDVELPSTMQRAMAKQAEAEREKRAKVLHAQGEFQAAQTLADAAQVSANRDGAGGAAIALPADADRDCRREELDDHFPVATGSCRAADYPHAQAGRGVRWPGAPSNSIHGRSAAPSRVIAARTCFRPIVRGQFTPVVAVLG
jgi:regulator of protease activity HflC (stomatin/prohibitin superfamily)